MKDKLLRHALSKAVAALGDTPEEDVEGLSLINSAFMLNALPDIARLATLRSLLAEHLQTQLSTSWIEQGDAHEVYSALAAVWKYDPTRIKGEWLASAIQRLLQSEAAVGGPYYTGDTIAIAANIQIAHFIRLVARPLPNMHRFFIDVVDAERFEDTEFTSVGLLYLLASVCNCEKLKQYTEVNWMYGHDRQTPLRTAVALDVLGNRLHSSKAEQALLTMCEQQRSDGLWNGEPLLKNTTQGRYLHLVTTALSIEALRNYLQATTAPSPVHLQQKRRVVARAASQLFKTHSEPLRSSVMTVVERVCNADKNFEVTLLPHFFARALDPPSHLSSTYYTTLGLANVCAWVAYAIYDDFIDNEGVPAELPVANLAMRASLDCFRNALPDDRFQRYVSDVFAKMDEANAWELDNCRFAVQGKCVIIADLPRYGKRTVLARRAFAHALTPMAILTRYLPINSKQWQLIEAAFRHYLIARQLNDDMHDWAKDIQVGQANYVVTAILRSMRIGHASHNLDELLPAMQKYFRHTAMPKICQYIQHHIDRSRQCFAQSRLLQPSNELYLLLDNLESSVHHSLDKRAKSQALACINAL